MSNFLDEENKNIEPQLEDNSSENENVTDDVLDTEESSEASNEAGAEECVQTSDGDGLEGVDESSQWSEGKAETTFWHDLRQWIRAIVIAMVIAYVLNVFVFERARVDGDSMLPTLCNNESLFEYKLGYFFREPKRGEIIIFEYDVGKYKSKWMPFDNEQINYVKRVIALPGETIDFDKGRVYIDGKLLVEPYLSDITKTKKAGDKVEMEAIVEYPYTVPEGHYFVMGDNREHSKDSRFIGAIHKSRIRGKVQFVMLPVNSIRSVAHTQPYFEGE